MMRRRFLAVGFLLAGRAVQAQLDLGSQDIPQARIDAYMEPFYRLAAAGLGSGRFLPAPAEARWMAGAQIGMVPLPSGDPFKNADLSALPLLRVQAGMRRAGVTGTIRGMGWRDPRVGTHALYGAGLAYERRIAASGALPWSAGLLAGWDHLDFSSTYTYHYRGSALGLFDQDIPGDYALSENVWNVAGLAALGRSDWKAYAQAGYQMTFGRFAYHYADPQAGENRKVHSSLDLAAGRWAGGAAWAGFQAEIGYCGEAYASMGWTFIYRTP